MVAWLKSEGDKVEMGEAVLTVESDKAYMDVESYDVGYLAAIITGERFDLLRFVLVQRILCLCISSCTPRFDV